MNKGKKIQLLVFTLVINTMFSQTSPKDTTYYENGAIKKIIFSNDWLHRMNYVVSYYTPITNQKKCGLSTKQYKDRDSTFDRIIEARFFLRDSSMINNSFYSNRYKILTGFDFEPAMYEPHHLSIGYNISKDSLIKGIYVHRKMDHPYFVGRNGKLVYMHINEPPTGGKMDIVNFDNKRTKLRIEYYDKYFLKRVIYWRPNYKNPDEEMIGIYWFYYGNKIKEHGNNIAGKGRQGKWYTYYENGVLKSEGGYSGSKFNEDGLEYDIKKTGKWIYYTKDYYVKKIEIWDNGKLLNTINCKK